jgi:hypothetical protein
MRIANKLISGKVAEYEAKKDALPIFDARDVNDIYDLQQIATQMQRAMKKCIPD